MMLRDKITVDFTCIYPLVSIDIKFTHPCILINIE